MTYLPELNFDCKPVVTIGVGKTTADQNLLEGIAADYTDPCDVLEVLISLYQSSIIDGDTLHNFCDANNLNPEWHRQ